MDNNKVKNEHYVPEFYLRKFSSKDKIFAYDLEGRKIFPTNVRKIACNNYFYDIEPDKLKKELEIYKNVCNIPEELLENIGNDEQFIEKALSRLENKFAISLEQFEKDYSLITDDEFLRTLFLFLRMQSLRTRSFRKGLENIATHTTEWLKSLNVKSVTNYPIDLDPKEIAKLNQLNEMISLPNIYKQALNFFDKYEIYIGKNNTDLDFIISDNPLSHFLVGFNDICFPVNPKLGIIMQVREAPAEFKITNIKPDKDRIINLTKKEILKYNVIQHYTNANYLLGSKNALEMHLLLMNYLDIIRAINILSDSLLD